MAITTGYNPISFPFQAGINGKSVSFRFTLPGERRRQCQVRYKTFLAYVRHNVLRLLPIASLHPWYRLLMSPLRWMFWDVPNHTEWRLEYLQHRSAIVRQAILEHNVNDNQLSERNRHDEYTNTDSDSILSFETAPETVSDNHIRDILSFACTFNFTPGRFIISSNSLRFTSSIERVITRLTFEGPYSELVEMSKRQNAIIHSLTYRQVTIGMDKLELIFRKGDKDAALPHMGEPESTEVVLLEYMSGRDKAFNRVIGFSELRWKHLQRQPTE